MEENYERSDDKLDGTTVYKQDFINRGLPSVSKVTRPQTIIAPNTTKFHDQTTHNTTFTPKNPLPQTTYGELPSFTGSILFPDPKENIKTTNQEVYKGKYAKVADLCKPAQAQVTIGIEGDYSHGTTHRDTFKTPQNEGRQPPRIRNPNLKTDARAKFQSETQFRSDFPGYGGKMPRPPRPIEPPPETVNLAMSKDRAFKTTNDEFFKISWDPKTIGRTQILKPDAGIYQTPQIKMETVTQSMNDFTQKEPVKMPHIRPQTRTEPSKIKFRDETAYKSQFKPYGTVPFQRYGDLHESAYYLKPVTKFYQDGSVTMQDFQGAHGGKPSTPHVPIHKLHNNEGEFIKQTTYNSTYVRKPVQECSYLTWVKDRETKKATKKILQQQQAGRQINDIPTAKTALLCGK